MSSEEVKFLRDQVGRLTSVLNSYQEKYLPIAKGQDAQLFESLEAQMQPPWLTKKNVLSPLIIEYDKEMDSLTQQNQLYQNEHNDLRKKVETLVAENNRLRGEMVGMLESQAQSSRSDIPTAQQDSQPNLKEEELVQNLLQQIELIKQEKENAEDMLQSTTQELDKIIHDNQGQVISSQMQGENFKKLQERCSLLQAQTQQLLSENVKIRKAAQHYEEVVKVQSSELEVLRSNLQKVGGEVRTANLQNAEMKKTVEQFDQLLLKKKNEMEEVLGANQSVESLLSDLQDKLFDTQSKLNAANKEKEVLEGDKKKMGNQVEALLKNVREGEQRVQQASQQIQESVQMVEDALLERDQALIREDQKADQLRRLEAAFAKLVDEAGVRTRQEVEAVRSKCNRKMGRLIEEVQSLEMENCERSAQVERAVREKRNVEKEFEKISKEQTAESIGEESFQELHSRLMLSERVKAEALLKVETLEKTVDSLKRRHLEEQDKAGLVAEQLKRRLESVTRDCRAVSEERLALLEEVKDTQQKVTQAEKNRAGTDRKYAKEKVILEQEMKQLRQECGVRVHLLEDRQRQTVSDLRQMLSEQQRLNTRWKNESISLTQKFTHTTEELRQEIAHYKKRSQELNQQLTHAQQQALEAELKLSEYSENNQKLGQQLLKANQRIQESSKTKF